VKAPGFKEVFMIVSDRINRILRDPFFLLFLLAGLAMVPSVLAADTPEASGSELSEMPAGYTLQYYDDCGVRGRQPHVPLNMMHTFPPEAVKADEKDRTVTNGMPDFDMLYDGLEDQVPYVVAVTYASEKGNRRLESLKAGDFTVHGPRVLPDGVAQRFLFKLPEGAVVGGKLTLHFVCNEGHNAVASVVELWAPLPERKTLHLDLSPSIIGTLSGLVSDIAYRGIPDVEITIQNSETGATEKIKTAADGVFATDLSAQVKPGADGVFSVIAQYEGASTVAEASFADLCFAELKCRPIPEQVSGFNTVPMLLDGVWRIHTNPPEGFQSSPTNEPDWADFTVPGQWLQQGFNIPRDRAAGVATDFTLPETWRDKRIILRFDAVHGGAKYWLNGYLLGSSENLFTPVEFDITKAVQPSGRNHLAMAITVDTPSELASYSSNYAFHNLGGIDRSVRVFALPNVHIAELRADAQLDADLQDAVVELNLAVANAGGTAATGMTIHASVSGVTAQNKPLAECDLVCRKLTAEETAFSTSMPVKNPPAWSDEKPNLCRLVVELRQDGRPVERIERSIGFRSVAVKDGALWVNGRRVKLAGVNRHETDPLTGRAATMCHGAKDARLFKEANFNYIRTSHYPPTAEFLDACDALGLYVECEAPFCWARGGRGEDDPSLAKTFLTPTAAMLAVNRHHPSIILWSIANESGNGPDGKNALPANFATTMAWCQTRDPSRPALFNNEWARDGGRGDIAVVHYPPWPPETAEFIKDDPRPVLLDEYFPPQTFTFAETLARNPGLDVVNWSGGQNGPDSFWEHICKSERVIGGAIWAGIDEEFQLPGGKIAGYGAWGFIDGWRRPKSLWWDAKRIFSPVWLSTRRVEWKQGQATVRMPVENRYAFTNLNELAIRWELDTDSGELTLQCPPQTSAELEVPVPVSAKEGDLLVLRFMNAAGTLITANGITLGTPPAHVVPVPSGDRPQVKDNADSIEVMGKNFAFRLNRTTLAIESDSVPLRAMPRFFATRVEDKNVFNPTGLSYAEFPDDSMHTIKSVIVKEEDHGVVLSAEESFARFDGTVTLHIDTEGQCLASFDYQYSGPPLNVGELGLRFILATECRVIQWKRQSEWDVYPEDHIGRPEGHTSATGPAGLAPYTSRPAWPWYLDANEYGTRDFRATKYNVYEAALTAPNGTGLRVDSDGTADVRGCLAGDAVWLHVLQSLPANTSALPWPLGTAPRKLEDGTHVSGTFAVRLLTAGERQ
jgi:hypothetical protein